MNTLLLVYILFGVYKQVIIIGDNILDKAEKLLKWMDGYDDSFTV